MGIIRLLLAFFVVLNHSYFIFGFNILGTLSVEVFYIISGFYMALILNEKYIYQNNAYVLFITNRLMKIFPIYLLVLFITVLFSIFSYYYPSATASSYSHLPLFANTYGMYIEHSSKVEPFAFFFLLFENIMIFFQDIVMFLGMQPSGEVFFTSDFKQAAFPLYKFLFIPQAWTIGLELSFYLIAPFLVRRDIKIIIGIIIMSFVLRFIGYYNGFSHDPWSYRFFPFEIGYFLLGTISYHIYKKLRTVNLNSNYYLYIFLFIIGLTFAYPVIKFNGMQYIYCFLFSMALPFIAHLTKKWKYDNYLGELSYPIYLVHLLVLSVIIYFNEYFDKSIIGAVYLLGLISFAVLLNEIIAKPIEKIRQRRVKNAVSNNEPDTNIEINAALAK